MSNLLYGLINPAVCSLLRSPLHGLMSKNTLLLEFAGRKPVVYCRLQLATTLKIKWHIVLLPNFLTGGGI